MKSIWRHCLASVLMSLAEGSSSLAEGSSRSTRVTLIRHGQTEWNRVGRFQGMLDSPLTERGVAQAIATRVRIHQLQPSSLYTSDLLRASRTAELLADGALPIVSDARLRERNFGFFEGKSTAEMEALHPEEFKLMRNGGPAYALPGGGESKVDVLARLLSFFDELPVRHAGEHVVVVSHGAALNVLLKHLMRVPIDMHCNWELHNLGYSTVIHRETGWKVRTLSDVAHLDAVGLSDE